MPLRILAAEIPNTRLFCQFESRHLSHLSQWLPLIDHQFQAIGARFSVDLDSQIRRAVIGVFLSRIKPMGMLVSAEIADLLEDDDRVPSANGAVPLASVDRESPVFLDLSTRHHDRFLFRAKFDVAKGCSLAVLFKGHRSASGIVGSATFAARQQHATDREKRHCPKQASLLWWLFRTPLSQSQRLLRQRGYIDSPIQPYRDSC